MSVNKLTKDDLTRKFIDLADKNNTYLERVSNILENINDNNKVHGKALNLLKNSTDTNTVATNNMIKAFDRMFFLLVIVVLALIVLAGVKNIKDFLPFLHFPL